MTPEPRRAAGLFGHRIEQVLIDAAQAGQGAAGMAQLIAQLTQAIVADAAVRRRTGRRITGIPTHRLQTGSATHQLRQLRHRHGLVIHHVHNAIPSVRHGGGNRTHHVVAVDPVAVLGTATRQGAAGEAAEAVQWTRLPACNARSAWERWRLAGWIC